MGAELGPACVADGGPPEAGNQPCKEAGWRSRGGTAGGGGLVVATAARRKSPRLAGVAPVGGLTDAGRCKRRRRGRPVAATANEAGVAAGVHVGVGREDEGRGQDAVLGLVQGEGRRVSARLRE